MWRHQQCCPLSLGAKEDDYKVDAELNKIIVDESLDKETTSQDQEGKEEVVGGEEEAKTTIGSIRWSIFLLTLCILCILLCPPTVLASFQRWYVQYNCLSGEALITIKTIS